MKSLFVALLLGGAVLVSADAVQAGTISIPSGVTATLPSPYQTIADEQMVVTGAGVYLRAEPSGKVLAKLKKGTKVTVVGNSGDWAHVKYKSYDGYISTKFLK